MNRVIKFRGMRNGELIYGTLIYIRKDDFIYDDSKDAPFISRFQKVEADSVSQFTGLTDKNGKEIFEGDIICIADAVNAKIEFDRKTAAFCSVNLSNGEKSDHLYGANLCKVIGNIYENPELLSK